MDLATLADLYDTLVVDGPTPAVGPPGGFADSALEVLHSILGALPNPLAVWLDGSPASVLVASVARGLGRDLLAVTTQAAEAPRVDDGGDAAALLGLPRLRLDLDRGLATTWSLLAERSVVPPADLWPAMAAAVAQQSGRAALLVGAGAEVPAATLATPAVGRARHDSADDARANYGCLPPRWGEWRLRLGLRRELIDPDLAERHPTLLGAPPRPPCLPLPTDEERAGYLLDGAMHTDGYLRPVLAAASALAGVPIVAPLAQPLFRAALAAPREGPCRAWRRLIRERVPHDLTERGRRQPVTLEADWLLAAEPRRLGLEPAAVARGGWFDAITVAHWLRLVAAQPRDPVNRLRARMLTQVAALGQRLPASSSR